jgi:hypothetical protein
VLGELPKVPNCIPPTRADASMGGSDRFTPIAVAVDDHSQAPSFPIHGISSGGVPMTIAIS